MGVMVGEGNGLVEMSQTLNGLDAGSNGGREQVFQLAATDTLNAGLEVLVNGVSELILVLNA